ncbi:MAG: beta-lactamase family protein [Microcella sp.]|uniref:serine hydrolase domain-containing protein n=1 Tax=Microcella sp. TaxID=1913979 RepID=UPI0024C63F3D|nr:serine hydrolase domain-containing protein [Microcella sp.]UYN83227.1 MAG: beta-lactamase family protein [Microcella sp.]
MRIDEVHDDALQALLTQGVSQQLFSGAAAAVSIDGRRQFACAGTHAFGDSTAVGPQSLFDLASVTKTFTAAAIVRLAVAGEIELDADVSELLEIGGGAKGITVRQLLTHTAGLPAESGAWHDSAVQPEARASTVLSAPLLDPPGSVHRYSCVGYIAAGVVAERVTGAPLSELLRETVLDPLSLGSIGFGPVDRTRAVATEEQPWVGRAMLRGEVHDELSWYLGGKTGNAGLFATADDVLSFAESLIDDRLFNDEARRLLTVNALTSRHRAPYGQALGARIGDRDIVGDRQVLCHPGFTGTMWLADPEQKVAAVLLTNRVHPHRDRVDLGDFRRRFSSTVLGAPR